MSLTRLPALAHDVLASLYRYRLLTTGQLAELHAPDKTARWVQMVLAGALEDRGLVHRAGVAGRREACWYLSAEGHRMAEGAGERRPYRMTADAAVGPLQAHSLAANAAALAFRRACLARGDDFGGWALEMAHPLGPGRADRLIVDAVVELAVVGADADVYVARFIELDRATERVAHLAAKLNSYSRLAAYRPGWAAYPRMPAVCIVIAGADPAAVGRRIAALRALAGRLALDPAVRASACSMADLEALGPFAPIWAPLLSDGPPVGLLG